MEGGFKTVSEIVEDKTTRKKIDLSKYAGRGKKMFESDAAEFVKGLRNRDRVKECEIYGCNGKN